MRLLSADDPRAAAMIPYVEEVCRALNIMNGAAHTEVIYTPTGPCLVETGARTMGAAGIWLPIAEQCLGYSSVTVWADLVLRPEAFKTVPRTPVLSKRKFGHMVFLVCRTEGRLVKYDEECMATIKALPSFMTVQWLRKPGDKLVPTTDAVSIPGLVVLLHSTEAQLDEDQAVVHALTDRLLVVAADSATMPPVVGSVDSAFDMHHLDIEADVGEQPDQDVLMA